MIFHRMFLINRNLGGGGVLFEVLENWKILDLEVLKDLEGHSQWRTKRFNKGKLSYLAVPPKSLERSCDLSIF